MAAWVKCVTAVLFSPHNTVFALPYSHKSSLQFLAETWIPSSVVNSELRFTSLL